MTLGDWIDGIKEEMAEDLRKELIEEVTEQVTKEVTERVTEQVTDKVTKEVTERNIKSIVEMLQEYHDTKENVITKIQAKFPECAGQAERLVEKYWKE